ncbi:unnamed protein product [Didymodactylos carnosus]|uniref:Uncharacterized protein n=1 Tax=Didymodactylos carnosus TaxID=1234261 RepID=A0A814UWB2_9BILA|nr:unnamed protein product [Didymodactylos carnosus]CAF1315299.1 unnamed protein product [Didymodactylos carnosus]CAF3944359.1 unnamed protein product [Didymodactylos carnosus]CAF4124121.1 unnamed protein product [Didymodactylos carnosus]
MYAACVLKEDGELSYSGPTYIAIRSAKHDSSTSQNHALDFERLISLSEFQRVCLNGNGQVKPVVIISVDGGPDENPRFPKTLISAIHTFRKQRLDALFILTYAPG